MIQDYNKMTPSEEQTMIYYTILLTISNLHRCELPTVKKKIYKGQIVESHDRPPPEGIRLIEKGESETEFKSR